MTDDSRHVARRNPLRLADIVEDLLWPHLLASVRLALRPAPIALGLLMALLVIAIGDLGAMWGEAGWFRDLSSRVSTDMAALVQGIMSLDLLGTFNAVRSLVIAAPAESFDEYPVSTIVLPLPILLVSCLFIGSISRIVAIEYAHGAFLRARQGMSFSLSHAGSIAGAQLGPWVFVAMLVIGLATAGWVLFSLPGVSTLGAILYPLFILGAFVAVIVALGTLVGCPMLIPAVTCEGVDGLDAVQRVYSLVFANPVRLLLYLLILGAIGAVALFVFGLVIQGTLLVAASAAAAWSGEQGELILLSAAAPEEPDSWFVSLFSADPTAPRGIAGMWAGLFGLFISALMISWYASASTMLFLLMRQATTGQERTEVWSPGMVEATMAEAQRARAAAGPEEAGDHASERLGENERHSTD